MVFKMVKRLLDLLLALIAIVVLSIPILIIVIAVAVTSRGPVIYWSQRVGRDKIIFKMPKFRTMEVGSPEVATHLLLNPEDLLTPIGSFLRRTSLDELPQIWSIVMGDMSFVGPRPALYNQNDLIESRELNGVNQLTPGLTGWAQLNGRDSLPIPEKVALDVEYLKHKSFLFDLKILFLTTRLVLSRVGVSH